MYKVSKGEYTSFFSLMSPAWIIFKGKEKIATYEYIWSLTPVHALPQSHWDDIYSRPLEE